MRMISSRLRSLFLHFHLNILHTSSLNNGCSFVPADEGYHCSSVKGQGFFVYFFDAQIPVYQGKSIAQGMHGK